ncbi:alpha/beta-Hydrolases superfamily protein [Rhynchospora pubera]|uniref:Alpha/beta-Hydrolases superfamily protein n=1 Tax=Rhynchospora pubera TaxID=906938 RepID=A0AAV8H7B7_9POAL|nr:alpha/beta-Hydrolases superfamily protein [Rhynchospora pubera]
MDPDTELFYDFSPFLLQYKSGRVERLIPTDFVPASHDPSTGITTRDVVIDPNVGLTARLYMPDISNLQQTNTEKLPVLIFIHGGGFVLQSAFSSFYHGFVSSLISKARVLAVSVDYRLAPEHPLPAAYDDSFTALKWVLSNCQSGPDPWLSCHGDSDHVFMAGDSAGGNIVHNAVARAGMEGIKIKGMVLMHPYFWGKDPVGSETIEPEIMTGAAKSWNFVCAGAFDIDHPCVNPMGPRGELETLGCKRVLVTVAEKDHFREWGKAYVEGLKKSAWCGEAELHVSEGEEHVFFLVNQHSEKAVKEMEMVVAFLNR